MKKFKDIIVIIASLTVIVCGYIYIKNNVDFRSKKQIEQENLRKSFEAEERARKEAFNSLMECWGCKKVYNI